MSSESIEAFYTTDEYIKGHPTLHEEDSAWKIEKMKPFIDAFIKRTPKKEVCILDVGGGAGIILKNIAKYLQETHDKKVIKYCLDLSPGMVEIQTKNNQDIIKAIAGDIRETPFSDKEIDLVLMIDVLEHVQEPDKVIKEIERIATCALYKVPLEDTVYYKLMDRLTKGNFRKRLIEYVGHINVYNQQSLKKEVEGDKGIVIKEGLTNVYPYLLKTEKGLFSKVFNSIGVVLYKVAPKLSAKLLSDYALMLVKTDKV
ncbi:MAG: class I SAM-dependent methyltransferase [Candidatus Magasanikbacteria bacterium]|jgi:SAM-dependent methyltransferase|nr:class I SAM-dependent methyltransferase [Candidatus Magasanikbacteria bacterium]MBT4221059.1 class I SAM-dependent methyltransferase [Candidatus Magasanikbacteria bacterium]MBT4350597.1 class I SAM-dependent methyltransferase [Candidatus Magasanikbacteria bacterium]MBT4542104.1 class I SAM-dependent methyltransferase [Candidatus Magasanikbacteria bacterium]MBT6253226.1 class I SAM-dependent methyltransferase [Candidatus Magasanikbacteria bacterium]